MFYAPPEVIETTVFASLPQELKSAGPDNEWISGQPHGNPVGSLLEGPSIDREGSLYCVDLPNGRILRVTPDGTFHIVAEYDGWPNGLKIHRDGRIFIADYKHGIMVLDPVSGKVEPYLLRAHLERFKAVNDLFFAANGDLYFTDQGLTGLHDPSGRLFVLKHNGHVHCLLDNIPSPNGLVMDLDEHAIYLAVTRANAVWKVPLMGGGRVAKVANYIQLSGGGGPDGLALDAQGRLFIAHIGSGSIWVMNEIGEPVYRILSRIGRHTTNIAFGGDDFKTLYITESSSGQILQVQMDIAGKPMFSHK